jgi:hypothetical protein
MVLLQSPVNQGATYTDASATATDNLDGNITANIITTNTVNTSAAGHTQLPILLVMLQVMQQPQ